MLAEQINDLKEQLDSLLVNGFEDYERILETSRALDILINLYYEQTFRID